MATDADVSRRIQVEARQVLGMWSVRVWATQDTPEGLLDEPFVATFSLQTLDFDSIDWQAACVLFETARWIQMLGAEGKHAP